MCDKDIAPEVELLLVHQEGPEKPLHDAARRVLPGVTWILQIKFLFLLQDIFADFLVGTGNKNAVSFPRVGWLDDEILF